MKKKHHKYMALGVSVAVSATILISATPIVYSVNNQIFSNQSMQFFVNLGIYNLIYFIPVLALINYGLIHLLDKKVEK